MANAIQPTGAPRLLRRAEVERRLGLSRTSFWRLRREGLVPRAVQVPGVDTPRWREDEIESFIESLPRVGGAGDS